MTTTISTPAALQAANTGAALRSALQPTLDALSEQFSSALAKALDNAVQQAQGAAPADHTAPQPAPQAATMSPATDASAGAAWQAPWLKGAESADQYLHQADADQATRQRGKPDTAQFMRATGCDFATASSLLYGVVGSNEDYRNWDAIMASADPVQSARQATGALYNSDLPYTDGSGFKPDSQQTLATSGNFAWLRVEEREGLWLLNNQGEALRQVHFSAPEILRATREFGLDPADLSSLADQMDARGIKYAPGARYTGSDHGVDLRNLAQGGMGAAYDWTSDPLAHLKGPGAQDAVAANALMAREMGLQRGLAPLGTPGQTATAAPANTTPANTAAADMDALGKQLMESLLRSLQNGLQS